MRGLNLTVHCDWERVGHVVYRCNGCLSALSTAVGVYFVLRVTPRMSRTFTWFMANIQVA